MQFTLVRQWKQFPFPKKEVKHSSVFLCNCRVQHISRPYKKSTDRHLPSHDIRTKAKPVAHCFKAAQIYKNLSTKPSEHGKTLGFTHFFRRAATTTHRMKRRNGIWGVPLPKISRQHARRKWSATKSYRHLQPHKRMSRRRFLPFPEKNSWPLFIF